MNPGHQIFLNDQENHNQENPQESITSSDLPNTQDLVTDYVPSKSENTMDTPNLRNFPDPRPFTVVPKTKSKPTQSNFQNVNITIHLTF